MLRKMTVTCAILAASISTSALADMCSGGYLGVNVGLLDSFYKSSANEAGDTIKLSSGSRGFTGGAFAGYGFKPAENFYLGGELHGSYANNNVSLTVHDATDGTTASISAKERYSFGISLIPGALLSNNILGFLRLGIVDTRFDMNASADGVSASSKKYAMGAEFGAGAQIRVSDNVSVRGEYVYTTYKSFNALGAHVVPSSDRIDVGVVFSFG